MSVFGPGSIALPIYPHPELGAPDVIAEIWAQARLAVEHGFGGVMLAEHHGGFAGYLPNPLQAAGWLLEAMLAGWAAPCPMILPLRLAMLVGVPTGDLTRWFARGLADLVAAMRHG